MYLNVICICGLYTVIFLADLGVFLYFFLYNFKEVIRYIILVYRESSTTRVRNFVILEPSAA